MEQGADTASFLASRGDIQKQLVLPATMRAADQTRYVAAYQEFHPSRLIFTRMDETEAFGTVLSETLRSRLPLSFFGTGQQVPDDLEPASVAVLLSRLLPDSQARSAKGAAA
ncbi:GTP-binding signal recognition particle SRP54, G-domain (fragment) [Candidatus Sulfopaludibacter sp. SbA3]